MNLFDKMTATARERQRRVVLPEGTEIRTLSAADRIIADGLAKVTLVGNPEEINALALENNLKNISAATIVNPAEEAVIDRYAPILLELRKKKGMTEEQSRITAADPLYLGCLMIKAGEADCMVAGAENTTGNVLRAAFQVIKTAPGIDTVSGAFLMLLPEGSPYGTNGVLVFADCAVVPDPDAHQLAQIALESAQTARDIAGIEPRVAMLSFSTKGSAKHDKVEKVIAATRFVREADPNLLVDGEMQADAALVPSVAAKKDPGSSVAGKANVLVFPSLEVGNIAYKLVQRLGGVEAIGPVLQGLGAPVNDLSRGASVDDIYKTIIMTCNQN
ncbi:MAG: phosphate acetyltransferase [Muribaculaceae bacterium]|nr:phosphate acetyltransferase [Muribaculaceae bacterium]